MPTIPIKADPDSPEIVQLDAVMKNPVERLLLSGAAKNVHEAEEMYLEVAYPELLALLAGPLSNEELGQQPLLGMYRSHGSRPREDSLL